MKEEGDRTRGDGRGDSWQMQAHAITVSPFFAVGLGLPVPSLSLSLSPLLHYYYFFLFYSLLTSHAFPHLLFLHKYAFNEDDHGLVLQWPTRPRARCLGLHSFHTLCVGFAPTISWLLAR